MSSFIAALDVGTTSVRCFILNENCQVQSSAVELVELLNPQPGYFEIEPESLWRKIVNVIKNAVKNANLRPSQISCLGISTQRGTFITWDHRSGDYFHNFITWKDLRANALVNQWNAGYTLKVVNLFSYLLYLVTRSKRFLAGSVLKMMNGQVTLRLLYEIQNNHKLRDALRQRRARIEFLDSWILYKLRSGNGVESDVEHITDITSCTATGLFDPFTLRWSPLVKSIFGIDNTLLPRVVDNAYKAFGHIHPSSFGDEWKDTAIPITASISDQTAAMIGSQCFAEGDVKITMGTGAFLNLMTGASCHASLMGMYPLVAWQFHKDTMYCVEGAVHDVGTIIAWGQSCGLFVDPTETAAIAESVDDTGGVFFIPAFSGLGAPINNFKAGAGFIGITPSTQRAHLIRALLESIVFRLVQLCDVAEQETKNKLKLLKVDGGVSCNNFVCQFLADASRIQVERASNAESSIMGATYVAGINLGLWQSFEDVRKFRHVDQVFVPQKEEYLKIRKRMDIWLKAIDRFSNWYL